MMGKKKRHSGNLAPGVDFDADEITENQPTPPKVRTDRHNENDYELVVAKVAFLYARGFKDSRQLAEMTGQVRSEIPKILARVKAEWRETYIGEFNSSVAEKMAEIAVLKRAAWSSFEKSQGEQSETKVTTDPDGRKSTSVTTRDSPGQKAFLDVIREAIKMECSILGIRPVMDEAEAQQASYLQINVNALSLEHCEALNSIVEKQRKKEIVVDYKPEKTTGSNPGPAGVKKVPKKASRTDKKND